METPTVEIPASAEPDLEMDDNEVLDVDSTMDVAFGAEGGDENANGDVEEIDQSHQFIDYLRSPVIELLIGTGEEEALLTAHQALLEQSPFFADAIARLESNQTSPQPISLPDESLDAMGCFLQFQYTGEYFPRRTSPTSLEPSGPALDSTGVSLLKHARVYTLAEKLSMPALKALAHSKIHLVNSTAKGEIAYARYVYANTPATDVTIRRPVAAFWATRSHVLRHEAEKEFKNMCLEYPQFGFDVLSLVLDQKEKLKGPDRGERDEGTPHSAKGRKRSRLV